MTIRPIEDRDDAAVASVIRTVMPEFGADGPGTALHDPEVSGMSAAYSQPRSRYFVACLGDRVVGGVGVAPLNGGEEGVAELRKMYLLPVVRRRGVGRSLLHAGIAAARELEYEHLYLETMEHMSAARSLYESEGFEQLPSTWGDTGHFACHVSYALALTGIPKRLTGVPKRP